MLTVIPSDGGTIIYVELPSLGASPIARGMTERTEHKVKESNAQTGPCHPASSTVIKSSSPKAVDSVTSLKIEKTEPSLVAHEYPDRIPFDQVHNELGIPTGEDMSLNLSGTHGLGAPTDPSILGVFTEAASRVTNANFYRSKYLPINETASSVAERDSTLWSGVEDLSLKLDYEHADQPSIHGLPDVMLPSNWNSHCGYTLGSSLMSNPSEASLHQTFPAPPELDFQNAPRRSFAVYRNGYSPSRRPDFDEWAHLSIDPRDLSLGERRLG